MIKATWQHHPQTPLGRFGGGWHFAFGLRASRLTREHGSIQLHLFVGDLWLRWGRAYHWAAR